MRKTTIGLSIRSDTSLQSQRSRLEARNFGFKKKRDCTICVAKTKTLVSCAVTAQLICVFVFAYAICWFSDAGAHLVKTCIQYNYFD